MSDIPKNYKTEIVGDIYALQIIPLDREDLESIAEAPDLLGSVYQNLRDMADDEDMLVEFNFLSEEGEREMSITDEHGKELDCDIDNYLNVYSYPEAVEYFKTHNEPVDDDYYDEYKKVIDGIKNIKCGEYGSKYIEKAIKKLVDKEENNFIEALIKVVVDEYGSDKKYLLIYGRRQESCTYSCELKDKSGEEYDEDSLMLFGSGTYSNGDIEMEVDSIADAIIYKDYYFGASDIDENHYIEEPVFLVVSSDLKPFDLGKTKRICLSKFIPILRQELPRIDPLHLSSASKFEVYQYLEEISKAAPNLKISFDDFVACVKACLSKGVLDDSKEIINGVLNINSDIFEKNGNDIVNEVVFSKFLEDSIARALQDGILTDEKRKRLKRRAELDGEDWDEVEMVIEARLAEIKKNRNAKLSDRLEGLISVALQDGVISDSERELLKRRAEREGVEWSVVEDVINTRLSKIKENK